MIKKYVQDNKAIFMFDCVNFITSNEHKRFSSKNVEGFDDYRIILTHGVIGELIYLLEKDDFGLDKSKIYILSNNIETVKLFNSRGYSSYSISEYIFTNEDFYTTLETKKIYDCIFPGRESKTLGIFNKDYTSNINKLYLDPLYPYPTTLMPELFNQSKTGLMTTEAEGSCLSVGEMLSCGLPIVSVKINNAIDTSNYYPKNKATYTLIYDIVLPNTLGGRELWLNDTNSIYCERTDDSIDVAINELVNKNLSQKEIRSDFLSKLYYHRLQFLYLLKSICDDIQVDLKNLNLEDFINLPYGNSTVSSTGWKRVVDNFKNSYLV